MAPGNSRVAAESLLDSYASRHDEWARGLWLALLPETMKQGWEVTGAKPPSWFRIEKCSLHLLREMRERGWDVRLPPQYEYAKKILGLGGEESSSSDDTPSTTSSESGNNSPARSRLFEADPTAFPAPTTSSAATKSKKKNKGKRKGKPKKKAGMAPPSALDPLARDFDPSVEEKTDDTKGVTLPSPPPPSAPMSGKGPSPSAASKKKKRSSKKRAPRRQTGEAQASKTGKAEVTEFTTTETITDTPEVMKTSNDNTTGGVVAPKKGHETSDNPKTDKMPAASMAAVESSPLTARSLELLGCTRPCLVNTTKWQEGWADWTKAELAEYGEQDAATTLKQLVDGMHPYPIIFMPKPKSEPASSTIVD